MDHKTARLVQRDQGSSVEHELPQRLTAVGTDASRIRRGIARRQSPENLVRGLVGKDDHVELIVQLAGAHDRVDEGRVRHLPLVEDPPGPALVNRCVV